MLASCFLALSPAMAGSQYGTVTQIFVRDSDGLLYVVLSGSASGRAACASGTTYWMIPNETTDTGKRLYATLLAAEIAGRPVQIYGKNTCNRWVDGEDIDRIELY